MAINFATQAYGPIFDVLARPVTFTPPVGSSFTGRGFYDTGPIDVESEGPVISDARTILDIIAQEFSTVPVVGYTVSIGATADLPSLGNFEVADVDDNGGVLTLTLRKIVVAP